MLKKSLMIIGSIILGAIAMYLVSSIPNDLVNAYLSFRLIAIIMIAYIVITFIFFVVYFKLFINKRIAILVSAIFILVNTTVSLIIMDVILAFVLIIIHMVFIYFSIELSKNKSKKPKHIDYK